MSLGALTTQLLLPLMSYALLLVCFYLLVAVQFRCVDLLVVQLRQRVVSAYRALAPVHSLADLSAVR